MYNFFFFLEIQSISYWQRKTTNFTFAHWTDNCLQFDCDVISKLLFLFINTFHFSFLQNHRNYSNQMSEKRRKKRNESESYSLLENLFLVDSISIWFDCCCDRTLWIFVANHKFFYVRDYAILQFYCCFVATFVFFSVILSVCFVNLCKINRKISRKRYLIESPMERECLRIFYFQWKSLIIFDCVWSHFFVYF